MCGRFSLTTERPDLIREFGLDENRVPAAWVPRFNLAPTQPIPVLVDDRGTRLTLFRWGLIPPGAKDPRVGNRMINARRETIAERSAFRDAFRRRRCLVVADGFYEWRDVGGGVPKVPHYIRLASRRPFTMAAIWSPWTDAHGESTPTCAIVTGEPNAIVQPIHDRMPVILRPEVRDAWLASDHDDEAALGALLRTHPAEEMEAFPVSRFVNSVANEGSRCIEPAIEPPLTLFPMDAPDSPNATEADDTPR